MYIHEKIMLALGEIQREYGLSKVDLVSETGMAIHELLTFTNDDVIQIVNSHNVESGQETVLDFVRRRLAEDKGFLTKVSRAADVPYSTLIKIHQGSIPNPRVGTIQKLADYYWQQLTPAEPLAA